VYARRRSGEGVDLTAAVSRRPVSFLTQSRQYWRETKQGFEGSPDSHPLLSSLTSGAIQTGERKQFPWKSFLFSRNPSIQRSCKALTIPKFQSYAGYGFTPVWKSAATSPNRPSSSSQVWILLLRRTLLSQRDGGFSGDVWWCDGGLGRRG